MALAGEAGGSGPLAVSKREGMRSKEGQSYWASASADGDNRGLSTYGEGGWAEPLQGGSSFCGRKGNGGGDSVMIFQEQMLEPDSVAGDGVNSLSARGVHGPWLLP